MAHHIMNEQKNWLEKFGNWLVELFKTPLIVTLSMAAVVIGILWFVFNWLAINLLGESANNISTPSEITLPLLLMITNFILLLALTLVVTIFKHFGLGTSEQPLGLPAGSIRAVIALLLIFIFAIVSVFLYGGMSGEQSESVLLTAEQYATLSTDRLVASQLTPCADGEVTCYEAILTLLPSEESIDFAEQTLAIIGTLVTALAGFYFGNRSIVVAARKDSIDPKDVGNETTTITVNEGVPQ